ncbi:16S rRNA (cytidine(1402)-2'-O)-methyltransferase [Candidatus Profftella armatura]|uniref:Ribosomal RNA small subunit methyltransferase I n=1 Tax=Candidatus Profftella armatura TaxID=669502 RepID=S5R8J8_9PROT|nr:16S rRNA (cytidine(1402)-2'-O)-methyltransferase [Candidatus Profftella armatura]AGS06910.1 uroporphyrin-III C/tetrapyrrole methyltransferase [Candidatus Profftella armatura]ALC95992.1 16S rRNA methyltransferase [Candidatus Profftella armatura]QLK13819.1 16S rRNA (cytidine(1402)-2'-O)-methyltransferase [Candidatus Profftella armatura]
MIDISFFNKIKLQNYPHSTLYVLATPIGNIFDITLRALYVLSIVDSIACEDTRNTNNLIMQYGLSKILFSVHKYNEYKATNTIITKLKNKERIALVSDSGTPTISDPGAHIISAVQNAGLRVLPIPGASSVITAFCVSGLKNKSFYFLGFLPIKKKKRKEILISLINTKSTLILYEAPHRIMKTVHELLQIFGPMRQIVFAQELTKKFEKIHRCFLKDAMNWLNKDNHKKGEFVLLIESTFLKNNINNVYNNKKIDNILKSLLKILTLKQTIELLSNLTGIKKNALYKQALLFNK